MNQHNDPTRFRVGEPMILFDERDRQIMFLAPADDEVVRLKGETLEGSLINALHEGELLVTPSGGATW